MKFTIITARRDEKETFLSFIKGLHTNKSIPLYVRTAQLLDVSGNSIPYIEIALPALDEHKLNICKDLGYGCHSTTLSRKDRRLNFKKFKQWCKKEGIKKS